MSSSSSPAHCLFVNRSDLLLDFKRAIATHEFERRQILCRRFLRQTGHGVVEDPFVVLVDAETRARILLRFDILANAKLAIADRCARSAPSRIRFLPKPRRDLLRACRQLFRRRAGARLSSPAGEIRATASRAFRRNECRDARTRGPSAKRNQRSKTFRSRSASKRRNNRSDLDRSAFRSTRSRRDWSTPGCKRA